MCEDVMLRDGLVYEGYSSDFIYFQVFPSSSQFIPISVEEKKRSMLTHKPYQPRG